MIMALLYDNSDKFPEGLFLKLCNLLKKLFVNHENEDETEDEDELFLIRILRYTECMRDYERMIHHNTENLAKVEHEILKMKPIIRMSKQMRTEALIKGLAPEDFKIQHNASVNRQKQVLETLVTDIGNRLEKSEQQRRIIHKTLEDAGCNVAVGVKYDIDSGITQYSH